MSGQMTDYFEFKGEDYTITDTSNPTEFFDLRRLGLHPVPTTSACWHGYHAKFKVLDDRLVLKTLHASLYETGPDGGATAPLLGPKIIGVSSSFTDPTTEEEFERWDGFNNHYDDLNYQLTYSGGVLISKGYMTRLMSHFGHSAWKYETVYELIFDKGQIEAAHDRSAEIADIRDRVLAKLGENPTRDRWRDVLDRRVEIQLAYTYGAVS